MRRRSANLALAAALFLASGLAAAGPGRDPVAWLERMSAAMSQMSYQGTFVYIQGDRLETMRITHVTGEDGVRERLVALSGAPREVMRDENGVRWALGDGASVLADTAFNRTFSTLLIQNRGLNPCVVAMGLPWWSWSSLF